MTRWQDYMQHEVGCTGGWLDSPSCTCRRDEWVAAIEAMMGAADELLADLCRHDEVTCYTTALQAALDRLNALDKKSLDKAPEAET